MSRRRVTVEVDEYAMALVLDSALRRAAEYRAFVAQRPYDDDRCVMLEWAADCVLADFEAAVGDIREVYDRLTLERKR